MTDLNRSPLPIDSDGDSDELTHTACECSPTINLCGSVTEFDGFFDEYVVDNECVVCADLAYMPCVRCGR